MLDYIPDVSLSDQEMLNRLIYTLYRKHDMSLYIEGPDWPNDKNEQYSLIE